MPHGEGSRRISLYICGVILFTISRAVPHRSPSSRSASLARSSYRKKDLPAAIQQYEIGVRLGDPSAMVSLAFLIKKNLHHVADPSRTRLTLLSKASQAGHKGAQEMLEREQGEINAQNERRQTEREQQQMMLNLFGAVLRGVAR